MACPTYHTEGRLVYTLELGDDGTPSQDYQYLRLPPPSEPYTLQLTLMSGKVAAESTSVLHTNYPLKGERFDRHTFQPIRPLVDAHGNTRFELSIETSGVYAFYVAYLNHQDDEDQDVKGEMGRFVVEPDLKVSRQGVDTLFPLDALSIQSTNPRWMGPLSNWSKHFSTAEALGYNALHFIPVQRRGESDSPYSIADQLSLDPALFSPSSPSAPPSKLTLSLGGFLGGKSTGAASEGQGNDENRGWKLLEESIRSAESEYGILSITDVVWNHTANNTAWLQDHPEAGYSLEVAPYLRPAYELDSLLISFNPSLHFGLSTNPKTVEEVNAILTHLKDKAIPSLKLWQYYVVDVEEAVQDIAGYSQDGNAYTNVPDLVDIQGKNDILPLKDQAQALKNYALSHKVGQRYGKKLAVEKVALFLGNLLGSGKESLWEETYRKLLDQLNLPWYQECDEDMGTAIQNITSRIRYERLDEGSPRKEPISPTSAPLLEPYFTRLDCKVTGKSDQVALANNGWIWAADPLVDFAGPSSKAYLRREVIVWGDCVKLRYGKGPKDNPWLWNHMTEYTERMAKLFHGFRIDNCHSTPLPVAEHLLDAARRVRPDLYILAELFTGSEMMDAVYVGRLGIHSMVREAVQPGDSFELSRLIHRHGGYPIGSLCEVGETYEMTGDADAEGSGRLVRRIRPGRPHALFYDGTHDNETPSQKRTTQDALPTAALVAFSVCAAGSTRGYDECYPRLLHVQGSAGKYRVHEGGAECLDRGIGRARVELNRLHVEMAKQGYREVHVHHEGEYIVVHRQEPETRRGYLLIARTAFPGCRGDGRLTTTRLEGTMARQLMSATLRVDGNPQDTPTVGKDGFYAGVEGARLEKGGEFRVAQIKGGEDGKLLVTEIDVPEESKFPPGSIGIFETEMVRVEERSIAHGLEEAVSRLNLDELNVLLYRCDAEERDVTGNNGAYVVDGVGQLPYCGFEGWMSVLRGVIERDDLGHPLCDHFRKGHWAVKYMAQRLRRYEEAEWDQGGGLREVREWMEKVVEKVASLPSFLAPKWVALAVVEGYRAGRPSSSSSSTNSSWIVTGGLAEGDPFVEGLALTSAQLCGSVASTGIHETGGGPSLAAGLPHFATNHMRCWGRDVFISLRGLLLLTGRWEEARDHITCFARSSRHGLIPNLLDACRNPRFNARDAAWWYAHSVLSYAQLAPEGTAILKAKVLRKYERIPEKEGEDRYVEVKGPGKEGTVGELLHEICEEHARGICFREWRAGPQLDSQMKDAGFLVQVSLDPETGIVSGGSQWNCGTWMDKMGSSDKAGNRGVPSTPRDGADVEIVGLVGAVVKWLASLSEKDFPHSGVQLAGGDGASILTYAEWTSRLEGAFDSKFFIPTDTSQDAAYGVKTELVNRRGIYRDTVGSCTPFADYQFRPNLYAAMAVSPHLFPRDHALEALRAGAKYLLGPLGMKTLDPGDWAYHGDYDN
ncbi:glucanotransferase domain of glycogen debranching enzyme-domain-containing protein, partial [Piptocephalis cylindrospora]